MGSACPCEQPREHASWWRASSTEWNPRQASRPSALRTTHVARSLDRPLLHSSKRSATVAHTLRCSRWFLMMDLHRHIETARAHIERARAHIEIARAHIERAHARLVRVRRAHPDAFLAARISAYALTLLVFVAFAWLVHDVFHDLP